MERLTSTIRFEIDGKWDTQEMGDFLLCLDDLYMLQIAIRAWIFRTGARGGFFAKSNIKSISQWMREANPRSEWLQIVRIQYGSKGFKDVAGDPTIVGQIKDFVFRILELGSSLAESRDLSNIHMELENARLFLELAREYNIPPKELRALIKEVNLRQQVIKKLVQEGKIRDVYQLNPGEEQSIKGP